MAFSSASGPAAKPSRRATLDASCHEPGAASRSRAFTLAVLAVLVLGAAGRSVGVAPCQFAAPPGGSVPIAATAPSGALRSYALAAPDVNVALPPRLNEVSGVTVLSDTEVACVQDEEGVIFVYDLTRQRVTRLIPFGPPGDYEGIARVGSRLFVLRSDRVLYEIRNLAGPPRVQARVLRLPISDYEGLCHDERRQRLLIAPKGGFGQGRELKDSRAIFAFDLEAAALQPAPILVLSVDAIRELAERQGRLLPDRQKKPAGEPRPALRFMPSALAVHPFTSEIFVVSAIDRVLATFDMTGHATGYASLDPGLFRQPEGITFLANGDLIITNEAAGRQPTLLLFKHKSGGSPAAAD